MGILLLLNFNGFQMFLIQRNQGARPTTIFSFYNSILEIRKTYLNFLVFKLGKYDNTCIGDLENTKQSYIYFHFILKLFFK